MSREIKFRGWLKQLGEYKLVYDIHRTYDNGCANVGSYEHVDFGDVLDDEECVVEQYTGLKDKNGSPIYEGDIIEEEFDDQTNSYEVIWDEIELTWSVKLIGRGVTLRSYLWELNASRLVVGNIHENKELLS